MTERTVGVEEELMLVDPGTGLLSQASEQVVAAARSREGQDAATDGDPSAGESVEQELFLAQLETNSRPCTTLSDLRASVVAGRVEALKAADTAGCAAVAVATPVLGWDRDEQQPTPRSRYQHIVDEFGDTSGMVGGMHVHVGVDDEEAVPVLDHLRPWLPVLLALSANSPYDAGRDTGHASWRSQVWGRWPTAGPTEPYGDLAGYRAATDAVVRTGAALDRGMLYLDARIAERFPTVEIRVSDVCTDLDDVILVAALGRALVTTVAARASRGEPVPTWRVELLRAARWRAARYGLADDLVHPVERRLRKPRDVVGDLLAFVGDALEESGDRDLVDALVEHLFARGTGATRQRSAYEATGSLVEVVHDLIERTRASVA